MLTTIVTAITVLGSVGIVALATATPSTAQPACTDYWTGPDTGTTNWGASAADWSAGIPNGSSVACVDEAGTYTVVFTNPAQAPESLQVGGAASGTQTVEINGANMSTTQDDEVEGGGVLSLVPTASADAIISGGSSITLTVDAGGTLDTSGSSETANIATSYVNEGTTTFGATSNEISGTTATNEGALTVSSDASVTADTSEFTDASGTLVNNGSFVGENQWTQSGTNESGNPVDIHVGNPFVDSAGTGSFTTYQTLLQGTIPAGQTVTNLASPGNSNDPIGTSTAGVTVDGTLDCETIIGTICTFSVGNQMWPGITVNSGGTLETTGPGSSASGSYVNLDTPLLVEAGGTATVANPDTQMNVSTVTNEGTFQVTPTGYLQIGGNTEFDSSGTLGLGVGGGAGTPGTIYDSSSYGFSATGTLAVETASGSGPTSPNIDVPNGGLSAEFSSYSFGSYYYIVSVTAKEVTLAGAAPFSASATPFSPAANEAITPQVASFNTNSEPGTYSATVNYGDGSGTQAATVNLSGSSGTVTGPAHTYTAPGTYTVTVIISTTAGTTITVTGSSTVTGPTITGLTATTIKPGKKLTTEVSGTNFDGTGTFTTSDPTNLTVVSVTFKDATKKKPAEYKVKLEAAKTAPSERVSLTLTQTGAEAGRTTAINAITIS